MVGVVLKGNSGPSRARQLPRLILARDLLRQNAPMFSNATSFRVIDVRNSG
jgi:hypothetical protein